IELTSPALFKSHITLPAFACEMPSRPAICASVKNSPSPRPASCKRQRRPYSSRAETFIKRTRKLTANLQSEPILDIPDFFVKIREGRYLNYLGALTWGDSASRLAGRLGAAMPASKRKW